MQHEVEKSLKVEGWCAWQISMTLLRCGKGKRHMVKKDYPENEKESFPNGCRNSTFFTI